MLELDLTYEQMSNNHSGGFLPLLFAAPPQIENIIGGLAGGIAAIANAVTNAIHRRGEEEEEIKRHNKEMKNS